jgi:hypothetical protein
LLAVGASVRRSRSAHLARRHLTMRITLNERRYNRLANKLSKLPLKATER